MKRELLCLFALLLGTAAPAFSQQPPTGKPAAPARAEVLVLGVYHMANPGHDVFNMKADDVLGARRQAEIAQVIDVLKRFHPTKIAVERDAGDKRIARDYAAYLVGKHELTRNEIEQLGFRLAKELGHERVYPVDADGEFPYQRLVDYAKASSRSKELEAMNQEVGAEVKAQGAYLASHTILETLLYMNSDKRVARDVGWYYCFAHFGRPGDWAGADLVADWVRRNMRIFTNVVRLINSPDERVLVIFGAGHLGWLRQAFAGDPAIRLRTVAELVN
jgi:Family of unknown function (DUF5694)